MVLNEVRILLIEKSRLVAWHLLLNHEAFNYLNSPIKVLVTYMCCAYIVVTKLTARAAWKVGNYWPQHWKQTENPFIYLPSPLLKTWEKHLWDSEGNAWSSPCRRVWNDSELRFRRGLQNFIPCFQERIQQSSSQYSTLFALRLTVWTRWLRYAF